MRRIDRWRRWRTRSPRSILEAASSGRSARRVPGRASVARIPRESDRLAADELFHRVRGALGIALLEEAEDHEQELGVVRRDAAREQAFAQHGRIDVLVADRP